MKADLEFISAAQFATIAIIATFAYDVVGGWGYAAIAFLGVVGSIYGLYTARKAKKRQSMAGQARNPTPQEEA